MVCAMANREAAPLKNTEQKNALLPNDNSACDFSNLQTVELVKCVGRVSYESAKRRRRSMPLYH